MIPAHERFDTDQTATERTDLRLVLDTQLLAFHGPAQLGFEAEAVTIVVRHGIKDEVDIASGSLGQVHRGIGLAQEFFGLEWDGTTHMAIADQGHGLPGLDGKVDAINGMAKALLEWETIDSDQLDDIMAGKPPRPPKDWTPRTPSSGGDGPAGGTPAVAADPAPTVA